MLDALKRVEAPANVGISNALRPVKRGNETYELEAIPGTVLETRQEIDHPFRVNDLKRFLEEKPNRTLSPLLRPTVFGAHEQLGKGVPCQADTSAALSTRDNKWTADPA